MNVQKVLKRLGIKGEVQGDQLLGLCPFHEERRASWRIRLRGEKAGLNWCFACHHKGNIIDLVMHVRGYLAYGSAVQFLQNLGEEPEGDAPPYVPPVVVQPIQAPKAFRYPKGVEWHGYEAWPQMVRTYVEGRGIPPWQVARWGITYAADGRLAGRVVVPVYDSKDVLCSYMARTFVDDDRRYLYPHESEGANLDAIFGERWWPSPAARRSHKVVVTEGAFKSLAVERADLGLYIGALGGSGVRPSHVFKLACFGDVILLTDRDRAGNDARLELSAAMGRHSRLLHAYLPAKKDADSVPMQELIECLQNATAVR